MSTPDDAAPSPSPSPSPPPAPAPAPAAVAAVAEPVIIRANRLRLSLVWIVPLVALAVGAVLVVRTVLQTGPLITLTFRSADGLEPGRTEVRYKEVTIGRVATVGVSSDRKLAVVRVRLNKSAADLAVADTKFWIVRPRVGTAGISGLNTLLSGAYIGVDAGESQDAATAFTGLEAPPFVLRGERGRTFALNAQDLGSLDVGSPLYYRRTRVGRVVGYTLDARTDRLAVQVFVEWPNEDLVTRETRFWNASGVDIALNASGLNVNAESLVSLISGGIAFGTPPGQIKGPPAPEDQRFELYRDRRTALAPPDGPAQRVRLLFDPAMRGLAVGAPVELMGQEIGSVLSVDMRYDSARGRFPTEVLAEIYPARLGDARSGLLKAAGAPRKAASATGSATGGATGGAGDGAASTDDNLRFLQLLVARGLRAQLRSGNLLAGQPYVALDLVKGAPRSTLALTGPVPTLPTVAPEGDLQAQAGQVLERLAQVRFEAIGAGLETTLKTATDAGATLQDTLRAVGRATATLQQTLEGADGAIRQLSPTAQSALLEVQASLKALQATLGELDRNVVQPDAPLQRSAGQALGEVQRAARALRVLGDYLQQHPESLLRGKPADAELGTRPEGRP